jgi:hypothetical protein
MSQWYRSSGDKILQLKSFVSELYYDKAYVRNSDW